MVKIEALFCPECKLATMRRHPQASKSKDCIYNNLYKCNFCGFTKCITTHNEDVEKMPVKKDKNNKKYF